MFNIAEWIFSGALLAAPVAATVTTNLQATTPAPVVFAADPGTAAGQTVEMPLNKTEALARANQAMNQITTAQGRFTQYDYSGNFSQGSFYLSRPGKMRFEYDDPVPILIVSDGTTLAIEDRDLETVDRVPLVSTPLNLLLRKDTDLAANANILSIGKRGGLVGIRLSDKSGDAEGELELFFDATTYELKQWESIDVNGAVTTVQLTQSEKGGSLSPRLFRIDDPEDEDDRR